MTAQAGGERGTGDQREAVAVLEPKPLKKLETICDEIFEKWDADQRSGKLLLALSGHRSNYRQDVTDVRRALGAAPDMLATLEWIAIRSRENSKNSNIDEIDRQIWIAHAKRAEAAIAKAEGRRSPDATSQSDGR